MKKICTKCKVEKDLNDFVRRNSIASRRGSTCKECNRAAARTWYHENREKAKAGFRVYQKKNRFKLALKLSKVQAKKFNHLACTATIEEIKAAFTGRCKICGVPEAELNNNLNMDHDHTTGEFRGWLCHCCNKGLGQFKDDSTILLDALRYLECSKISCH